MNQMIENLGNRMVRKMAVVNIYGIKGNKFAIELKGMCQALDALGIDYEFDFNEEVTQYTAITIDGKRFAI